MKQETFNRERAAIAAFAPLAEIKEIGKYLVMDVPVRSTDNTMEFSLRLVYDEDEHEEITGLRVYALSPTFREIAAQLTQQGLEKQDIDRIFLPDRAGNHLLRTDGAMEGSMAIANANAHLTLVAQLLDRGSICQLLENPDDWKRLLPAFGVNSCGHRITRPMPAAAPAAQQGTEGDGV